MRTGLGCCYRFVDRFAEVVAPAQGCCSLWDYLGGVSGRFGMMCMAIDDGDV